MDINDNSKWVYSLLDDDDDNPVQLHQPVRQFNKRPVIQNDNY